MTSLAGLLHATDLISATQTSPQRDLKSPQGLSVRNLSTSRSGEHYFKPLFMYSSVSRLPPQKKSRAFVDNPHTVFMVMTGTNFWRGNTASYSKSGCYYARRLLWHRQHTRSRRITDILSTLLPLGAILGRPLI
ncbi:hypothetical protein BDW60DRAFT_9818 [Aspergillus nidulans var. acristatus]